MEVKPPPQKLVVIVRHVIGYLVCVAFLTLILTFVGPFFDLIQASETHVGRIIDVFRYDPDIGPWTSYTVHMFGLSFAPVVALGHVIAVVASPVGLLALMLYFLMAWVMPAR